MNIRAEYGVSTEIYLSQRLSLREPLQQALKIVARLANELALKKEVDLPAELEKVKVLHPQVTSFQRDFASLALSIATGVGKTRLMGALVAWLHLEKGIRNFFVLAPNLTIYEKLMADFGDPGSAKYVFKGISRFVHNRPIIVTGDNYNQQSNLFGDTEVRINIFNIAKFNTDSKASRSGGQPTMPRIKRLSEFLGQSYWDYLTDLEDLVILMDEAHRYHADASKNAINELKPVLGLELTATPMDEKGQPFKNVVYEYSLAQALADGKYVKNPAIATRKNFRRGTLSDDEVERIKLEDAVSVHLDTKAELALFAATQDQPLVKPFVLVVCRDIEHARKVFDRINTADFYDGQFAGKVLQIDSSTRRDEDIEKAFLALEKPESEVEIVIHVNMLKEGWDVTNLYTIVPLRAANAAVLVEQTLGRGLRLPFGGKRTGHAKVDKLTIVAHDNFDAVVAAAQDPKSVLNKLSFVELDMAEVEAPKEVVIAMPVVEARLQAAQQEIAALPATPARQQAQNALDAKKAIIQALPTFNSLPAVRSAGDLAKPEVKRAVMRQIESQLQQGQLNVFAAQIKQEAEEQYEALVADYKKNIIEIPRMDLVPGEVRAEFKHFDLDTSGFQFQALDQEILRMGLKDKQVETLKARFSGSNQDPVAELVSQLIDFPELDYGDNGDLLYHLAAQAVAAVEASLPDRARLGETIFQFKTVIAEKIYAQIKLPQHFQLHMGDYRAQQVLAFQRIEPWNYMALTKDGYKDYRDVIIPVGSIPRYIFRGFEKACHFEYKFDSKAEQDMAFVLENDAQVLKWLRPAPNQFRIYWTEGLRRYEPDFVVETADEIYLVETKSSAELSTEEVLKKSDAARKYCANASEFTAQHGGKPWAFLLVPHDVVQRNSSWGWLVGRG